MTESSSRLTGISRIHPTSSPNEGLARGIVVHLAATGDTGKGLRLHQIAMPLADHGYASLILIVPFYGIRKPDYQHYHYVDTVADYLQACTGCFVEGKLSDAFIYF